MEVDQFVPYMLDTGDTAIHKPPLSSRCYPIMLSRDSESLGKTMIEESIVHEKNDIDIVGPSQCPPDRNCGPSTMTDVGRTNDPHRAIWSNVLAA